MSESAESLVSETPNRWIIPHEASIQNSETTRNVAVNPATSDILSKEGKYLGQIYQVSLEMNPGEDSSSLDFSFRHNSGEHFQVITSGWQSWSSAVSIGGTMISKDNLIGIRPLEKAVGGETDPFVEPGPGKEKIPDEGRSYGWVCFRDIKSGENIFLGIIPSLDGLEQIKFAQEDDRIKVRIEKKLGDKNTTTDAKFRIFLGRVNPKLSLNSNPEAHYIDLLLAYSKELGQVRRETQLMQDRIIGFSWPVYGVGVTQATVTREIQAGEGIFDTYIVDDGWEEVRGTLTANQDKFPDLAGLFSEMKTRGIKPGLWIAPFIVNQEAAGRLPEDWFMRGRDGKPLKLLKELGQSTDKPIKPMAAPLTLDVSVSEFREYLVGKFTELAAAGVDVFKVDFLAVPFTGPLKNKDKTAVEYYRQVFEEIREGIRKKIGKEIELIGCGAPVLESIGLFNGIRFTTDTALPEPRTLPRYGKKIAQVFRTPLLSRLLSNWFTQTNTTLYRDAAAVASRRAIPFSQAHGLVIDGIHINDPEIFLDPDKKTRINEMLMALKRMGVTSLFIGDSLARIGTKGRLEWQEYIKRFKNTQLLAKLQG